MCAGEKHACNRRSILITGVAAGIANAVYHATGKRIRSSWYARTLATVTYGRYSASA
jgi:hypothetical protein